MLQGRNKGKRPYQSVGAVLVSFHFESTFEKKLWQVSYVQSFSREGGDEEKHVWRHSENPGNRPTARFTTVIEKVKIVEKNFINIINIITNSINNFTNIINIFRFPGRPDTMMTRFIVYTELKKILSEDPHKKKSLITFLQTKGLGDIWKFFSHHYITVTNEHRKSQCQGCIKCGILVSRIRAHGVSSEHMENMEMFSCSPTQVRSDSQRTQSDIHCMFV